MPRQSPSRSKTPRSSSSHQRSVSSERLTTPRRPSVAGQGSTTTTTTAATRTASSQRNAKVDVSHEYEAPSPSYLSETVFFPLYDWLVQFYPTWFTPNGITIFGILCTLFSSCLIFWFVDEKLTFRRAEGGIQLFSKPAPENKLRLENPELGWLLLTAGMLNLVYVVADNTDGRHARRTKQSSRVGEYLDHGLDCSTSLLTTFGVCLVLGVSVNVAGFVMCLVAFNTLLSHIIHYEAKVLIWGNSFVSVDEAMLFMGFGLMLPHFFPGLTSACVPLPTFISSALAEIPKVNVLLNSTGGVRVVDLLLVGFVLSQLSLIRSMCMRLSPTTLFSRFSTILMVAHIVLFGCLTPMYGFPTPCPFIAGHVSYAVLWCVTNGCLCATISHVAIAAKCLKQETYNYAPLGGVFIVWCVFLSSPVLGCLASVVLHSLQMGMNISALL